MALNDAIAHYPGRIDYAVSLHPECMKDWQKGRKGNQDFVTVSLGESPGARIDHTIPELWRGGSSSLYACQVAIELFGFREILLCGVPMTDTLHATFFEGEEPTVFAGSARFRHGWIRSQSLLKPYVRSMSGWTRELLGGPQE